MIKIKKKIITIAVILLFIGLAFAPSINANTQSDFVKKSTTLFDGKTLYVGGSGPGNYTKIQDAINDSTDGYTIFVYQNTYFEHNILVNKSITIIGEDRDTTIIDGEGNKKVLSIVADYVRIQELTIQNAKDDGAGIYIWSNYSEIINNNIRDNYFDGIHLAGISHDNVISNNIIDDNNAGIKVNKYKTTIVELENNTIINNTIDHNYKGIILTAGRGEIVSGNTISNSDDGGIWIHSRSKNTIKNNNIVSNSPGIWILDSDDNLLFNNKIEDNSEDGISISSSDNNNIFSNEISNNNKGIEFGNCVKNIVEDNTFSHNKDRAIFFECTSYKNEFLHNRFNDNNIGIHVRPGNSDNIFSYNSFFDDGFFIESFPNTYSYNKVNGKPFIYLEDESNEVLDNENVGQIICASCNSITIKNHDLSNTCIGIQFFHCSDCVISSNNLRDNKRAGIHIRGNRNNIIGNDISNNGKFGIYIIENNNLIENNHIYSNDECGVHILGNGNSILGNNIEKNSKGVYLEGASNKVQENNFISNRRGASFKIYRFEPGRNKWAKNYWNYHIAPFKIIFGTKIFVLLIFEILPLFIPLVWLNVDLFPAQEPYDIGV